MFKRLAGALRLLLADATGLSSGTIAQVTSTTPPRRHHCRTPRAVGFGASAASDLLAASVSFVAASLVCAAWTPSSIVTSKEIVFCRKAYSRLVSC